MADKDENSGEKVNRRYITPWIAVSTLEIKDSLLRFHNEVIDFYNYIKPSEESHRSRLQAFEEYLYINSGSKTLSKKLSQEFL